MVVAFRGTRADVVAMAERLAAMLAGREPDTDGIARGFLLAIGVAALSDIKEAFVVKARGGTDEMGIKWPPLSPNTIANRRVGPKNNRSKLIAEREKIRKRKLASIKREFKKQEGRLFERFSLSLDPKEARRRARQVASAEATRQTGLTKAQTLGGRDVEILRDTGVLLNSLSPGRLTRGEYTKPGGEGGNEQIMEPGAGEVIVGTNVAYAGTHQHGNPSKNIPPRPFLPRSAADVPAVWWDRWGKVGKRALKLSIAALFKRGRR